MDEKLYRKLLFKHYNDARKAAGMGKLDIKRLNKALGLALKKNNERKYHETTKDCECADHSYRNFWCKHIIKEMLLYRVYEDVQGMDLI